MPQLLNKHLISNSSKFIIRDTEFIFTSNAKYIKWFPRKPTPPLDKPNATDIIVQKIGANNNKKKAEPLSLSILVLGKGLAANTMFSCMFQEISCYVPYG